MVSAAFNGRIYFSDKTKHLITHAAEKQTAAVISIIFMMAYYVLPQYFGLDTPFFDLTAQRIMIVVFFIYLAEKKHGLRDYFTNAFSSRGIVLVAIYLFVLLYTALFRKSLGTILYSFIEFVALFIVLMILRDCLGIKQFIKLINVFIVVLCISGIIEFFLKKTPFSYLETILGLYTGSYIRSGDYRIMGPANHALGYGLMLITMIPFVVIDTKKDQISFVAHPISFLLLTTNVFLTGSRSTLGIYLFELVLVFIFCPLEEKKKTVLFGAVVLTVVVPLILVTSNTSFSRYILRTFMSVIDQVFGTSYAARYGADVSRLESSSHYRSLLKRLYKGSWLNPLLGQGSQFKVSWTVSGWTIESVDDAYICMYIKYGYPGLISYVLYIVTVGLDMLIQGIKNKSGLFLAMFIGVVGYFLNLKYVDTLQTIKYVYILFAVFFACYNRATKQYIPYWNGKIEVSEVSDNSSKNTTKLHSYIKKQKS